MCGYSELTSSDPEVRARHWTIVGIGAAVLLTFVLVTGTLVFIGTRKSVPQNEAVPAVVNPEAETATTVL